MTAIFRVVSMGPPTERAQRERQQMRAQPSRPTTEPPGRSPCALAPRDARSALVNSGHPSTALLGCGDGDPAVSRALPIAPLAQPARRRLPLASEARPVDGQWRPVYVVWEITLQC